MINYYLRAKHWQLFLLILGIPILLQLLVITGIFSGTSIVTGQNNEPTKHHFILSLALFLFFGLFFGWLWSIVVGLHKQIPKELKLEISKFKLSIIIPISYIFFLLFFLGYNMSGIIKIGNESFPKIIVIGIILSLHLVAMICIFYCFYFAAKIIKTVELQKEVGFKDFVGEFFLTWYFPIGVWFLQPKINKMIEER